MAIPAISPYPMPQPSDVPASRVSWSPDARRAALLIHDMQNYFLAAFSAGESPLAELIAHIRLIRERCRELGIPVIYSAQPGGQTPEERGLQLDFWGAGVGAGDRQRITDELEPADSELVLTKWRYSAFCKTELADVLRRLGRDQLIVCGVYAHIGCLMTACDAFMRDMQPFLVADAVADFSPEYHRMALTYAAERCAVTLTTRDLLKKLAESGAEPAQSGGKHAAGQTPLTPQLLWEHVAELLDDVTEHWADDDNLLDLGLDSIRLMSLIEKWRRYGAEVGFAELAERPTLADWWRLLSARMHQSLPNTDYFAG